MQDGPEQSREKDPAKQFADHLAKVGAYTPKSPLDKAVQSMKSDLHRMIAKIDGLLEKALQRISPDVIFLDIGGALPSVENSGIPWVLVASGNVLSKIDDERTPPSRSGRLCYLSEVNSKAILIQVFQLTAIGMSGNTSDNQ